jgi:glycosyltransferase involved in cell wall biosynthesis
MPSLTIASTILSPVGGVSEVRVTAPLRALAAEPDIATLLIANGEEPPAGIPGPKIVILHRPALAGRYGLYRIGSLMRAGWLVVCEFDDHPDYIKALDQPDVLNFRGVHAVQTSTGALAAVLRAHNPEVAAFDNAIEALPAITNFADPGRMRLFFAGINRDRDWMPYLDALNRVTARFTERLWFEVVSDRNFFEALETDHKSFTPLCDYDVYKSLLAHCEISFMPLAATRFNDSKSDLKFIEAAACRVAALASPVVYARSIEDGRTGLLFASATELEDRLSLLIEQPERAQAIAGAARQYVADHRMLRDQIPPRIAWYRSLWERRDALHRAVLERVPELA